MSKTLGELKRGPILERGPSRVLPIWPQLAERRLGRWKDAIRDGETAVELDPQKPFCNQRARRKATSRFADFNDAERLADKGIKSAITQTGYLWRLKSEALVGLGKLAEACAVLEKSPPGMDILYQHIWAAVLMRDFRALFSIVEYCSDEKKAILILFLMGWRPEQKEMRSEHNLHFNSRASA